MKKVLSVITCSILAACSCNENQWEEVDVVTYDEPKYEEQVVVEPARVVVEEEPVYTQMPVYTPDPQPVACPCSVQVQPCYQPVCYQPCPCMQPAPQPVPQPKVTTSKKIITTTTTIEEPCGKPVCEPVVTTHEEVLPETVSYSGYGQPVAQPVAQPVVNNGDYVNVTVEKTPYQSEVVDMRSAASQIDGRIAAKYSPEAYDVVATRATNRMLQDTATIYDNGSNMKVFLKDTKLLSSDLPYGSHRLRGTTKDIISGSNTFEVVNNANNADYIIDSAADWFVTNNAAPALQYKLSLLDKTGRKVNEWVEVIRQVQD